MVERFKRFGVNMKNTFFVIGICVLVIIASIIFTGCDEPEKEITVVPSGNGLVSISIAETNALTILPDVVKNGSLSYNYIFEWNDKGDNEDVSGTLSSSSIILGTGKWKLNVNAFYNEYIVAHAAGIDVNIVFGINDPVVVFLVPFDSADTGTLEWDINIPAGYVTGGTLTVKEHGVTETSMYEVNEIELAGIMEKIQIPLNLAPGIYNVDLKLNNSNTGKSASVSNIVHIYPKLKTTLKKYFEQNDFYIDPGEGPHFSDDFYFDGTVTLQWVDWYSKGYSFADYDFPNLGIINIVPQLNDLPSGSFFRVFFEGLGAAWPEYITSENQKKFIDEFMTFGLRGDDKPYYYIELEGLGNVNHQGIGDAFFAIDPINDFIQKNPLVLWDTWYEIGYDKYFLQPGQFGNPKITETEPGLIELEIWIPKEVNKTHLQNAVKLAEDLLKTVVRSNDGFGLSVGTLFAPINDYDAFSTAINNAKTVLNNPSATHEQVSTQLKALNAAEINFRAAILTASDPGVNPLNNYIQSWTIAINWLDYYGTFGYVFADYSWPELGVSNFVQQIMALPAGSYFRIEFDGLDGQWPQQIWFGSGNNRFLDEYVTIGLRGHQHGSIYMNLSVIGKINDEGKGEVFFAVDPIKTYIQTNPTTAWATYYEIGYLKYGLRPGDFGNPKIVEIVNGANKQIQLEAWVPAANGGGVFMNALHRAVTSADDLLASVQRSISGSGLATGTKYARPADYDTFSSVIFSAKNVFNNPNATLAQANTAVNSLNSARKLFIGLIQTVGASPNPMAYRITAQTSRPNSNMFTTACTGNNFIEITVSNIDTSFPGNFNVNYTISDFFDNVVVQNSLEFNTSAGATQSRQIPIDRSKPGYFTVRASIINGPQQLVLPSIGTRPANWLNYAVVVDPSTRRMNDGASYAPYSPIRPNVDKSLYFGLNIIPGGGRNAPTYDGVFNIVTWLGLDASINPEFNWSNFWNGAQDQQGGTNINKLNTFATPGGTWQEWWGLAQVSTSLKELIYNLPEIAYLPKGARTTAGLAGAYGGQLSAFGEAEFRKYCEGIAKIHIVHASHRPLHYYQMTWEPVDWWTGWTPSGDAGDRSIIKLYEIAYEAIHRIYAERAAGTLTLPDGSRPAADPAWNKRAVVIGPALSDVTGDLNWDLHQRLFNKGLGNYIDGFAAHLYDYHENAQAGGEGTIGNGNDVSLANGLRQLTTLINNAFNARNPILHPRVHDKVFYWGTEMGMKEASAGGGRPLWVGQVLTRYNLIALGEGYDANHIFCFTDYNGDQRYGLFYNCSTMANDNERYGPGAVSPKHAAVSFAAMSHLMKGYVGVRRLNNVIGNGSKWGYKYRDTWNGINPNGPFIYAVWDYNGVTSNITLNLDESGAITVYDITGNEIQTRNGNSVNLTVSENVLYVKVQP